MTYRLDVVITARPRTLFAKMWHMLLALMLVTFAMHALLVTGTLQLGSEAQTERRLQRIGVFWSEQAPLTEPLRLDPVTVIYPRYELLPSNLQKMLRSDERGLFELGSRAQDYFVLAKAHASSAAFYVVEYHSEVKPNETIEYQVFSWYLLGAIPFAALLLWLCKRITAHVAAPMREVGRQVVERTPGSLEPLTLPPDSSVELAALVNQINNALQRTADVLERERSFTEFASHELRTPAAVIQAALERIEAHRHPEQGPPIERAQRGLRDMHALIDTFLQLCSDGAKTETAAPIDINSAWLTSLFHHVAGGDAGRELRIDVQSPLVLAAPATMVHVLIANLLKNALFHGGSEPIEATVSAERFEVRNSMPDHPPASGHGLGCLIARRICERFGWAFELKLSEGMAVAHVQFRPPPQLVESPVTETH